MKDSQCPGQNTLFWKPEDIFDTPCPVCAYPVEFFKDDATRKCSKCGYRFMNPRLDLGCAEWCPFADKCSAVTGGRGPFDSTGPIGESGTDPA